MPEIVEVKKYVDLINKYLRNKNLYKINIINGRYKKNNIKLYDIIESNLPLKLIKTYSKGKLIYFKFVSNKNKIFYLLNTLGLSGGWTFKQNDKNYIVPKLLKYVDDSNNYLLKNFKHISIEFNFINGTLYFYDLLHFGTLKFIENIKELKIKLNNLGPDIMDNTTTLSIFTKQLFKKRNKEIGIVLLNQKIISGIGNYLRAESLWLAKINPFKKIEDLSKINIIKLYESLKIITWSLYNMKKGIQLKFIKKNTKIAYDYNRDFFIYRQNKDIYNNNIIKQELYEGTQKRYIYWVPYRQK